MAEIVDRDDGRRRRGDEEGARGCARLPDEGLEAQVAKQGAVVPQQPGRAGARPTRRRRMGFGDGKENAERDDEAGQRGEDEHAAPAVSGDEPAAERHREHRAEGEGHGQVGDGAGEPVGAVDVPHDRAGERDAAGAARRLHAAPGEQQPDRVRRGRERAAGGKQQDAADQDRPAPEPVGQRTVGQRQEGHDEQRQADRELAEIVSHAEPGLDARHRREKHLQRHRPHQGGEHQGGEQQPAGLRLARGLPWGRSFRKRHGTTVARRPSRRGFVTRSCGPLLNLSSG